MVEMSIEAVSKPQDPQIENKTLTNKDTEYSQAIPNKTEKFTIKARASAGNIKFTFASEESGTKYIEVEAGQAYTSPKTLLYNKTLYMQSPTAGVVVVIICFVQEAVTQS